MTKSGAILTIDGQKESFSLFFFYEKLSFHVIVEVTLEKYVMKCEKYIIDLKISYFLQSVTFPPIFEGKIAKFTQKTTGK